MDSQRTPTRISLLHATRKRVERALGCKDAWLSAAADPGRVEHVFAIDPDDDESASGLAGHRVVRVGEEGRGCVGAWNLAAAHSTGSILVQLSDDWVPARAWDVEFEKRLRDVSRPAVLRVSDGHRLDDLLCMAIFTRAWLEELGTFLSGDYFSVFSDDEFSYRAYAAGVVIDARDLVLEHAHPSFDSAIEEDETYKRQNSSVNYQRGREAFLRRNPEAVGRWLHEGTELRYYLPAGHDALARGRVLQVRRAAEDKSAAIAADAAFARRARALLLEKKVHAQVFRGTRGVIARMVAEMRGSLAARLGLRGADRRRLDAFLLENAAGDDEGGDPGSVIERLLEQSARGVELLSEMSGKMRFRGGPGGGVLKALKAQIAAQQKWWEAARKLVQEAPASVEKRGREPYAPPAVTGGIPVYVISFNQLAYLRNMVGQLLALGVAAAEIHVVDNHSSLPPLLDYLDEIGRQGCVVHRMPRNLGPRGIFEAEAGLSLPPVFAVTDPDIQFHAAMPRTFREDMLQIAAWSGVWKCGCALNISERDEFTAGDYFQGRTIADWEKSFWADPIPGWPAALAGRPPEARGAVFNASVDTTFAVYSRDAARQDFLDAARVAGCFEARHLPWYKQALGAAADGVTPRLADGRPRVRPSVAEEVFYRRLEHSSTTSKMEHEPARAVILAREPESGYEIALAPDSPLLARWQADVGGGAAGPLFHLLRGLTVRASAPARCVIAGRWTGPLALLAAMRCARVDVFESDDELREDLRLQVRTNRLEHIVTVHTGPPVCGDQLAHTIPMSEGALVLACSPGSGAPGLEGDFLSFAGRHADRVLAVIVSAEGEGRMDIGPLAAMAKERLDPRWRLASGPAVKGDDPEALAWMCWWNPALTDGPSGA